MQVLSHRGYWLSNEEKNQEAAFRRSFAAGFGTETDIRDCAGRIVIAHDPPNGSEILLSRFLEIYREYDDRLPLALNVKADGLQKSISRLVDDIDPSSYFFFDMSIPDMLGYVRSRMPVFTRHSDVEAVPALYEESVGVWSDDFHGGWASPATVERHLAASKRVCIVSSELHGRDHLPLWNSLARSGVVSRYPGLMICTDFPQEARDFFS